MDIRIGQGYDIHRLENGRKLILGGVEIPFEMGLLGHSDADVLTHAIIDAMLGAAGLGDIGRLFPDDDPEFKDADSIELLKKAHQVVLQAGFEIVNIDSTVIAQAPKLAPYIDEMRNTLANALGIKPDRVNVKAKTNEKLDAAGQGRAMQAFAAALVSR